MASAMPTSCPAVWLAPMSGATDAPFRRQVVRFGAHAVVSEMAASDQLIVGRPGVVRRTCRHEAGSPWIVQLVGRRPEDMEAGARLLAAAGVDQIDINMGCPSRQVTGGLSGSALMQHPELAKEIIAATLAGAGQTPVSLKMRLGWDDKTLNAPEIGHAAEQLGVVMLTVHGRTRCQFYKGSADWARISDTVDAVSIPVIANGDIATADQARMAMAQSGAAGVMIGRAAIGRPWLPAKLAAELGGNAYPAPTLAIRLQSLVDQVRDATEFYGDHIGVRVCRKHISAAIADAPLEIGQGDRRALQSRLCQINGAQDLETALKTVFQPHPARQAA